MQIFTINAECFSFNFQDLEPADKSIAVLKTHETIELIRVRDIPDTKDVWQQETMVSYQ